ncbi:MAG TPA: nucleotide exchange factor GrpE, partial [Thermoanaerobaculia bacterium]|nr:nucleotide exchange factor GrpE [Thermoanaerobaculia bacterium]
MADDMRNAGDEVALDLDEQNPDLETAMREAVAAVEEVESGARGEASSSSGGGQAEVERLREEIADLRDRSMRTLADFDNFRKRSERERQDLRKYALVEPIREFLTVMDNLDLALSAGGSAE